jgi:hypothetical protein
MGVLSSGKYATREWPNATDFILVRALVQEGLVGYNAVTIVNVC